MIWPTNYYKMACQVAFTLFFAGSDFAPDAIINGKNIEEYLQDSMLEAIRHFTSESLMKLICSTIPSLQSNLLTSPTLV